MVIVTLATKAARRELRNLERRPQSDLENYFSPEQEIEIYCTTQEREEYEEWTKCELAADVLPHGRDTMLLISWLTKEYGLRLV